VRKNLIAICILIISKYLFASHGLENAPGKIGISVDYNIGKHLHHSPKIVADLSGITHAYEISCFKQTTGEKDWMRKLRYPEIGGALHITQNVNPRVFGTTVGFMGTVKFFLLRSRYADMFVRLGAGGAIHSKHYHVNKNAENNVIGSALNAMFQLRIGADFKPLPWLQVAVSGVLTHQSNGGIQLPNLGINVAGATIGIRYFPIHNTIPYVKGKVPKPFRPNEFMFRFGFGVTDQWRNGPKYPMYFATFAYARYTSIINKVVAGFTLEYNYAIRDMMAQGEIGNRKEQRAHAFTPSFFIGDEIIINRVGMLYALGVYVYHPSFRSSWIYAKAGVNYYFVDLGKNGTIKPYIGAHLKAHKFIAQTIEFGTGFLFR